MDRRQFLVRTVVGVTALCIPIPKWIGNPAGGFYRPVPEDISTVVDCWPWRSNHEVDAEVMKAVLCVVWASPGATEGTVSYVGGDVVLSSVERQMSRHPGLAERKKENLLPSIQVCCQDSHEPGWFKTHDGRWRRVNYLEWIKPSKLMLAGIQIAA